MKTLLLPIFAVLATVASALADATSPLAMCAALEARMAAGDGVTLPDADAEIVRHAGTIDLSRGEWPEAFAARAGETVCVAVSPVGPSVPDDFDVADFHKRPGVAYDFEPDPVTSALKGTNAIPRGWPKGSPARMYPIQPPTRRQTP